MNHISKIPRWDDESTFIGRKSHSSFCLRKKRHFIFRIFRIFLNCSLTSIFFQNSLNVPGSFNHYLCHVCVHFFQSLIHLKFHGNLTFSNCRLEARIMIAIVCFSFCRRRFSVTINCIDKKIPKFPPKRPGFSHKIINLLIKFLN